MLTACFTWPQGVYRALKINIFQTELICFSSDLELFCLESSGWRSAPLCGVRAALTCPWQSLLRQCNTVSWRVLLSLGRRQTSWGHPETCLWFWPSTCRAMPKLSQPLEVPEVWPHTVVLRDLTCFPTVVLSLGWGRQVCKKNITHCTKNCQDCWCPSSCLLVPLSATSLFSCSVSAAFTKNVVSPLSLILAHHFHLSNHC